MWSYAPPLRDMRFVIEEVIGAPARWAAWPSLAHVDADTARLVLEEGGKFAAEVLAPTNAAGDAGCQYKDGSVTTPPGFKAAYRAFVEAGWPSLVHDAGDGGQGLPQLVHVVFSEMLASANHAWMMYPGLLHAAVDCIDAHGCDELKARVLPYLVSGQWLATMCLTEAHAGSDLGLLRTRAEPAGDGSYRVTGSKIFISGGESDFTDNIVHLVLARLPDAPPGTRGISLFVVPKLLPRGPQDGDGFEPNGVRCDGIEHKMGIRGSATCAMSFDGARGWLVGEPHRGLAAMFVMMNSSRLLTGLQGLSHAENALQNARQYTAERVQMRAAARPPEMDGQPRAPADPIAWHPAVRQVLWDIRARVEGCRVLAYDAGMLLDQSVHEGDSASRAQALEALSLLTPVIKAYLSEMGFQSASEAMQLFGGHGYVHDHGIEQTVRDSRIAMIYEGTNEIQAIDLLVRKIVASGGERAAWLAAWIEEKLQDVPGAREAWLQRIRSLSDVVIGLTGRIVVASKADPEAALRVAPDFLRLVAHWLLGAAWTRADAAAARANPPTPFHDVKRQTAVHFMEAILPDAHHLVARIDSALTRPLAFMPLDQAG